MNCEKKTPTRVWEAKLYTPRVQRWARLKTRIFSDTGYFLCASECSSEEHFWRWLVYFCTGRRRQWLKNPIIASTKEAVSDLVPVLWSLFRSRHPIHVLPVVFCEERSRVSDSTGERFLVVEVGHHLKQVLLKPHSNWKVKSGVWSATLPCVAEARCPNSARRKWPVGKRARIKRTFFVKTSNLCSLSWQRQKWLPVPWEKSWNVDVKHAGCLNSLQGSYLFTAWVGHSVLGSGNLKAGQPKWSWRHKSDLCFGCVLSAKINHLQRDSWEQKTVCVWFCFTPMSIAILFSETSIIRYPVSFAVDFPKAPSSSGMRSFNKMETSFVCLVPHWICFSLQGERPLYLQLDPSKALLAQALVTALSANRWHYVSILIEDTYANDGFLDTFIQLTHR